MALAIGNNAHVAKSDLSKKLEIIKELQQLRIKEQNLEKDKSTHIYERRGDLQEEFSGLKELDARLKTERNAESMKLKQHYVRIQGLVQKFRLELENVQPSAQFVEKLKAMMEDTEGQISVFKEQQRSIFEQILKEERAINIEMSALERHVESWSQPENATDNIAKPQKSHVPLSSARDVTQDLPPEVAALEKFLQQTGGNRGGWDEYDHGTFLKYRNRFKGKLGFVKELSSFLSTRSEQEIRDHEVWYQEYVLLNDVKKEAIQKWREKKDIEKDGIVAKAGQSDLETKAKSEEEEARRKALFQKEKEQQRVLVDRWKIEKKLLKAEEEEKQLRLELETHKKEELDRQRKMELKRKVDEYRMAREKEEEEMRFEEIVQSQAEQELRNQHAQILIAKYRERDLEAVKQKKEFEERERKRIEQEKTERIERLKSLVVVNVERDPNRLLQPTELWKERKKCSGPSGSGRLLHMPRRAVPTWRQGMS